MRIQSIVTPKKAASSNTKVKSPPLLTCAVNSKIRACGSVAMIPTMISMEIPLPIPLSVIRSPSHIASMVPVESMIMLENQKGGLVIPRINPGKEEVKISGAGVLKDYKLIGYLDDQETSVYNWLTDKAKGGDIAVEYKGISTVFRHFDFDRKIELSKVENGNIYLNYIMETEGSIEEFMIGKEILDNVLLKEISREVEKRIENEGEKLIKKFQQEFKTDLIGARDYLSKYQPKLYKTIEKDYEKFFTDSLVIEVTANVNIR